MVSVSIVVLNWNGRELLERCLSSLKKNTRYTDYEVILVDNGSEDGSQTLVRKNFPDIKLIENEKNLGFSRGVNKGLKIAKGEYLFLLNNDTEVTEGWLSELVKVARSDPSIGIVGCKLIFPDGTVQHAGGYMTSAGIAKHYTSGVQREVEFVTGGALLIKREVIKKIGFLDEKFSPFYFEDIDWCFRAKKNGYKVIYSPNIKIIHHESLSMKQKSDNFVYFVKNKNRVRFMLKHFSKVRLIEGVLWEILRFFKSIFKLRTVLLIKAYIENLKDIQKIIKKRRTK